MDAVERWALGGIETFEQSVGAHHDGISAGWRAESFEHVPIVTCDEVAE